ncbi:hypothetical protein GXW82_04185 [Streptacidiphilus sp. 4-A2]|nr:hypothetical protein [Streptacidiphilus sp. 4-A2]
MDRLDRLAGAIDRRGVPGGAYSLAALAVPDRTTPPAPPDRPGPHPPAVGMSQVRTARALLALFSEHDAAFGAGPVRESLRQYLASTVVWLRSDSAPAVRATCSPSPDSSPTCVPSPTSTPTATARRSSTTSSA